MFLMLKYALLSATVLMLVALGGCFSEHSGVINLALEGIMVIGGLVGTMALNLLPADMLPVWKVVISICLAAVSGIAYSSLLAFSAINLKADQTIGGTALNLLSTAIALVVVKRYNGTQSAKLSYDNSPFIFQVGPLTLNVFLIIGLVLLAVSIVLLYKTRFGLRLQACGEHPQAAGSVGINVYKMRWAGVLISGFLAGIGGFAYIVPAVQTWNFEVGVAGMGFLAVFKSLANIYDSIGWLSALHLTKELYNMMPFAASMIILAFTSKRSRAPKAEGIPYDKGQR